MLLSVRVNTIDGLMKRRVGIEEVRGGHDDWRPLAALQGDHPVPAEVWSLSTSRHVPLITLSKRLCTFSVKIRSIDRRI